MNIRENVSISTLTTMRIGGQARYVIEIKGRDDIKKAYDFAAEMGLPVWTMGGGANTIGRDTGFRGVILLNQLKGVEIVKESPDELILKGMGGEIWDDFVAFACQKGYSGMESLSGIPGTLGAAPVQNIGAYGQEISQIIEEVEAYDSREHRYVTIKSRDMKMKYRQSIFNHGPDAGRYFIISVTVRLHKNHLQPPFYKSLQGYIDEHEETDFSPENIRRMVLIVRNSKLPDPKEEASAGSFFKNVTISGAEIDAAKKKSYPTYQKPDGSTIINSGWLIENAGLKGKTFNGFRISEKAALILINDSAKTYEDLKQARTAIKNIIKAKYGYDLEQEPVEIEEKP